MNAPKLSRAECIAERKSTAETARKLLKLLPVEAVTREGLERMAVQAEAAVYHLTQTATIPNNGTKVHHLVRVCHDAEPFQAAALACVWRVAEVCPFRGVRVKGSWHRSWVRVKGGAK